MIEAFLSSDLIAVAGASRDPKKFGAQVVKELKARGKKIYPVNPETDDLEGEPCYRKVSSLPPTVDHLLIVTPKTQTMAVLKEAYEKAIGHIWIQQMSETPEVIAFAKEKGIGPIHGKCILMFLEPVSSIHKFHRAILKFFGRLPK